MASPSAYVVLDGFQARVLCVYLTPVVIFSALMPVSARAEARENMRVERILVIVRSKRCFFVVIG